MPVGRNDPCPCGGGKKFKSCHAGNLAELHKVLTNRLSSALIATRAACSDAISANVEHKAAGFKRVAAEIALHMVAQGGEIEVSRLASRHVAAWLRDAVATPGSVRDFHVDMSAERPRVVVLNQDGTELASFDLSEEPPVDKYSRGRLLDSVAPKKPKLFMSRDGR